MVTDEGAEEEEGVVDDEPDGSDGTSEEGRSPRGWEDEAPELQDIVCV